MDAEHRHSRVWKMSLHDTDERNLVQALQGIEATTEDLVGGGTKGDGKGKGPIDDPGPVRKRTVHQRDPGLFAQHEGGK